MDNGKLSIDSIFNGRNIFYIPDYQRGYAWDDKQLKDFYDDFQSEYKSDSYYYGTILLQPQGKDGIRERFDIVDGQQRLTTLIIFLNCVIAKLRTFEQDEYDPEELYRRYIKNKEVYILSIQSEDNDFFSSCIIDGKESSDTNTPTQKRLIRAKRYFDELIAECELSQIINFINKIISTNVLVYLISNSTEAAMIFETTNDRGKALTNLEKTKSFLMYKAAIGLLESEQIIDRIQTRFNRIYNDYISVEQYFRDENSILQYCFIATQPWTNKGKQKGYQHYMEYMKEKTDEYIVSKDEKGLFDYIDGYTGDIQQTFSTVNKMYQRKDKEFLDIVSLGRVANVLPLLVKCYRLDKSEDKERYRRICRLSEVFIFRVYVIRFSKATRKQTSWYEFAREFDGDFDKLEQRIISLINSTVSETEFIEAIKKPDFNDVYSSPDKNYFYWKYENYLRDTEQPVAPPISHDDLNEKKDKRLTLTIEHIVARRNSEEQSRVIKSALDVKVGRSDEFNEKYLNSIGNLTLDPQSSNSSKGRKDVTEKISNYFVYAPYKCQNELSAFLVDDKWTLDSIVSRENKLVEFAKKTWCDFTGFVCPVDESTETSSDDDDDYDEEL